MGNTNEQKGSTVLLMTMMILMGALTVTLAVSEIIENGLKTSRGQSDSTMAYFASEAGAERVLWEARRGTGGVPFVFSSCPTPSKICFNPTGDLANCAADCADPNIATTTLSNGALYYINYNYAAPTTTLSVYGEYKSLRRKVELKY